MTGATGAVVASAFGAKNRSRLIESYFAARPTASEAWEHVYRLLLWVDQTSGLAHCYESDKSQPGKNWYGRSLAFHDWASRALGVNPTLLAEEVDWLFRHAAADLATEVLRSAQRQLEAAQKQREPFERRGMPKPGEDPELIAIIREELGDSLRAEVSQEKWQHLIQRIRQYISVENKRANLVGEGFEDVIAAVLTRSRGSDAFDVRTRCLLHELPGFNRGRQGEKPNKVDVAVLPKDERPRILITAKWSVRADREKQFAADYSDYVVAESERKPFEYVFVTNEFDPARLMRACESLAGNQYMFTRVVHINPEALKATYGATPERSMKAVLDFIDAGRLLGLDQWLGMLCRRSPTR